MAQANELPLACSLEGASLQQRLETIAELGADGLVAYGHTDGGHLLRFRRDPLIRERLEAIVKAEAECCSFLDLLLRDEDGELRLLIRSTRDGRATADEVAAAFAGIFARRSGPTRQPS